MSNKDRKKKGDDDSDDDDEEMEENPLITLLKNRDIGVDVSLNHIYFRCDVSTKSVALLTKIINSLTIAYNKMTLICKLANCTPKPFYLHITSNGGTLIDGLVAHDVIKYSKIPIYTIVEGNAFSAASLMSIAGKKRFITENSFMLIHQLRAVDGGTYEQLEDSSINNKLLMTKLKKIYMDETRGKLKKKDLEAIIRRDIYLDAHKAMKMGLVDEITNENTYDD
jgi:ATP-dependent Clp protease protease subunit